MSTELGNLGVRVLAVCCLGHRLPQRVRVQQQEREVLDVEATVDLGVGNDGLLVGGGED